MKKLLWIVLPTLLMMVAYSCSKDHEAPTFSKFNVAKKPTNVEATYVLATDAVNVTWDLSDETNVVDYIVYVSDTSDFDLGEVKNEKSIHSTNKIYVFEVAKYLPADVDSTILYFSVSAVYRSESLSNFIGPRSDEADSSMIKRVE